MVRVKIFPKLSKKTLISSFRVILLTYKHTNTRETKRPCPCCRPNIRPGTTLTPGARVLGKPLASRWPISAAAKSTAQLHSALRQWYHHSKKTWRILCHFEVEIQMHPAALSVVHRPTRKLLPAALKCWKWQVCVTRSVNYNDDDDDTVHSPYNIMLHCMSSAAFRKTFYATVSCI